MKEVWKPIKGFENQYEIRNDGLIHSFTRKGTKGGYSWGYDNGKGYLKINLFKDGIYTNKKIHRLVWETFMGDIPNGYDVHHINGIKTDNRLENLCLIQMVIHRQKHNKLKSKIILQFSFDNELIAEYSSTIEAEKQTKIPHGNIIKCCKQKLKTAGGFIWKYKEVA